MDQDLPTTTGSHDVEAGVGSESGEGRAPPLSPRNTRHSPHCAPIVKDEIHSLRAVTPPMKRSRSLCSPSPTDEGPAAIKEEQQSINPVLPSSTSPRQPTPSPAAPRTPVKQPPLSQVSTNGPVFTPSQPRSQGTPRTPFLESQIGPHNSYLFGEADAFASQSPMGSTGTPGRPSVLSGSLTNGGLISHHGEATGGSDEARESEHLPETAHILVPETVAPTRDGPRLSGLANQAPANQSRPPDSSPDALDLINRRSPSLTPPPETVTPFPPVPQAAAAPAAPVDPALERFRTARSFRTRTTLQLQPYTRERALYEAALRKGGMFKAKRSFAIPRDATQPDDEDGEEYHEGQERSTADPSSSQAIVIAPSLPPREPSLVPLIEADYDEYLMLHRRRPDSAVSISDLSQVTRDGLQEIAKRRIEADKEAARKAREAKRLKKRFERLLREQERGDPDDETYRPMPAKIPPARKRPTPMQQRTPSRSAAPAKSVGGRVTYSNRLRRPVEPSSESEASAGVRPSNTTRPTPSAQNDPSPSPAPLDFGLGPIDGASSPQLVESSDSDLSNSESTSGSDAPQDKRAKIARRMLPAAMLRRLEQEAARKEREKDSARRKAERRRTPSPVRPGRAIVRHGGGDGVDFADFIDSVADGRSSSHSPVATPLRRHPDESDSDGDRPIVIDSSSGDSDSQAEEDHGGHGGGGGGESLAQLYRGDFESLVAGKGRLPNRKRTSALDRVRADHRTDSRSRRHRPALGLVKQTRAPTSRGYNKSYVQTRLDFEPDSKPSHGEKRKRKHLQPTSPVPRYSTKRDVQRPRPAIRLDDHVIFATDDFAFDDHASAEAPIARPAKRPFTKAKSSSAIGVETLDAGIGKARSWAYLDKLSVDFGISPLPSGLYCSSMSAAGSGRLAELVEIANGRREVTPQGCVAYGVELYPSLSADAVQAVVPIIFDKMYEATTARVLSKEAEDVDIKPIRFFADYIVHIQDGGNDLRSNLSDVTTAFSDKLDLLDLPSGKAGRHARAAMLSIRWAIVELAACLAAVSSDTSMIARSTAPLLSLLLTTGFDKAIRPLKKIIRGESDSAEISDPVLTTWVAVLHVLQDVKYDTFLSGLTEVIDAHFPADQVGPLAAERIWYLVFGLCALHQFDVHGRTSADYVPMPRWAFVRRAIGLIKISHNEEAEEGAHLDQLQGRDRYIKIMLARCVRLSSVWQWPFDRESFSIATKDLGVIFKDRQYRNLPTESPVDFPAFISQFNMALTAAPAESKRESAFELYLRLVCVAASDLIAASQSLSEAQQAEKDVQRLVMSIMPVSPVKFDRLFPPTPRQLGQLINRYSTMVAATYFSPSLLSWLLSCSKKWVAFESADFDSRQVSIRGLMYVAVACRHHGQSLHLVVDRLAEILSLLQKELDQQVKASAPVNAPSRLEVQRTMVLVVSCVRQIILHDSFDPTQTTVSFPDPSLLHESEWLMASAVLHVLINVGWTTRVFALDLSKDLKCSSEVVATIQAFLDTRLKAMPPRAKRAREEKIESQDEFGSLEFELDDTTLMQLGGGEADDDPVQKQDDHFAKVSHDCCSDSTNREGADHRQILESVVCPRIYRLLSDMLPAVSEDTVVESEDEAAFMARLTKCFADCAAILVVDHRCLVRVQV